MLTRRTFLQASGLTLVAVGPVAGCHVRRLVEDPAFAGAVVLGDSALCVGCRRCELSCSALRHPGRVWPEQARLSVDPRILERETIDGLWFADACHECPATLAPGGGEEPPPCIASCPTGALRVARIGDGPAFDLRLRIVDPALCDGCELCIAACPYKNPRIDPGSGAAVVCDLCAGREGGPACVEGCPSSALSYHEPWRFRPPRPFPWEDE